MVEQSQQLLPLAAAAATGVEEKCSQQGFELDLNPEQPAKVLTLTPPPHSRWAPRRTRWDCDAVHGVGSDRVGGDGLGGGGVRGHGFGGD